MPTNIVAYFADGRFEVDVAESLEDVTTMLQEADAGSIVVFKRERGGAAIINPSKVQYILLTEGGE